jgi:hypothetical protein
MDKGGNAKDYSHFFEENVLGDIKRNGGSVEDYVAQESEYAFLFHFGKKGGWGERVLDFGGRIGEKTRKLQNVTVVEVDTGALRYMQDNGIGCINGMDSIGDGKASAIYCSHVLEHVEDPFSKLKGFYSKLMVGGAAIIVVPAELQTFEPSNNPVNGLGHLQGWNLELLSDSLQRSGFTPILKRFYWIPRLPFEIRIRKLFSGSKPLLSFFNNAKLSYFNFMYAVSRLLFFRYLLFSASYAKIHLINVVRFFTSTVLRRPVSYATCMGEILIIAVKK